MHCPKCNGVLPEKISKKLNFCPICGARLFGENDYMVEVSFAGQRNFDVEKMRLFLDESIYYEVSPGEKIVFVAKAGFHSLQFRYKIRSKTINILLSSDFSIKTHYNTLSSLIETTVGEVDQENYDEVFGDVELSVPVVIEKEGLDAAIGQDVPEYSFNVTSGLKEGILRLYPERLEFESAIDFKKEILQYKDAISVRKKMGSIDITCDGNVHKIYSIPKDIYNEVLAFLNNRIEEFSE